MSRKTRQIVFSIRLTEEEYIQLCKEAKEQKKKPSTLAREKVVYDEFKLSKEELCLIYHALGTYLIENKLSASSEDIINTLENKIWDEIN